MSLDGRCFRPCSFFRADGWRRHAHVPCVAFVSTFTPSITSGSVEKPPLSYARRMRPLPNAPKRRIALCSATDEVKSSPTIPEGASDAQENPSSNDDNYEPPEVILDENIVGFCSIDPSTGKRLELSVRDKENLFLDAVQSFYRGENLLSNDEFDSLKEELTWQGSDVVTLSRDEFRFLDAAKAYERGKPIMSDDEFDSLKRKLFEQGSVVAIQRGPRCSIERKVTFSDIIPDKKRTFALFVPAGILMSLFWLSFAFELTPLHRVDPVISLLLGSPVIWLAARSLTYLVVPNAQIMVGDCPDCGRRTHVLFGNVLNQKGFSSEASVKCEKCKAQLKVERETSRMILMKQGS